MESEVHALQRKADIHAWLSGYANACDAFHQTASSENGEGAFRAMTEALAMAGLQPSDIQYVNAHGTGTPNNDQSESNALLRVFGSQMPMVSSTKGFTGHATSAAGGIEAVICLLAISNALVPANLGWTRAMDSGVVPTMGEEHCRLTNVMTNSFGFGGNDSSLVFSAQPTENTTVAHAGDLELQVLAKVEINSVEELPGIAEFVKPLEARRMGKLMKSSLLSSLKALKEAGIECPDAVVTATAYGCLEYS
jgi:3-oxoacyl-(acyl-carrier-protein) synthase